MYLGLHIWNDLPDTLGAKWFFQTFKRPPIYKWRGGGCGVFKILSDGGGDEKLSILMGG